MKRIQEKVKDLIEVHSLYGLQDFIFDPAQIVAGYHFTASTAELMAKWLDEIARLDAAEGAAKALAGYRGVGKSHFLATLGAILAHTELRAAVADQHVSAAIEFLKRRRYPVVFVRRGLQPTLLDELRAAIASTFDLDIADLSFSATELLAAAASQNPDLPLILLIDTAFEREARVMRDDGVLLGEIAAVAKQSGIFVAVALDDDIAEADGANAAIARDFTIDFLDQEHLYSIVEARIFPKHRMARNLLREIYAEDKRLLPDFRWSEPRFIALYPLHPIILEIAPFVRLYAPEFTLLGFASDMGGKILGRPASSLIAPDEVFDAVETTLRKAKDLIPTFAAYDRITNEIIGQIPIMQRLRAKLVLKAFLLLSLDGEGATAADICSAMLIYDEADPTQAVAQVGEWLERFAAADPEQISRRDDTGRDPRFCFKIGNKDSLNQKLVEASRKVAPAAISQILRRMARERFSDWTLPGESEVADRMESQFVWRGGQRRGRIVWNADAKANEPPVNSDLFDWELTVVNSDFQTGESLTTTDIPQIFWRPADLRQEEADAIRRFYVLLTDPDLREEFAEQIRAAGHAHTIAIEKIWSRVFLDDARFLIDGEEITLSEAGRAADSLAEILTAILEPLFENRFPNHPWFDAALGKSEVSVLIHDFFGGAKLNISETQILAEIFALPLGLAARHGEILLPETEKNLAALPLAREILSLVENRGDAETVALNDVYQNLRRKPFGLAREAQQLILAALVARRQIEFVTAQGNRINRRSLDLKIIWDDIVGIAPPSGTVYSSDRLTAWAQTLTGADDLRSIDTPAEREAVYLSLQLWLEEWQKERILTRFDALTEDVLNTKIWRAACNVEKTFGAVAETLAASRDGDIALEEALSRVADTFSDSESEFFTRSQESNVLRDFIAAVRQREEIISYLALCEPTDDEKTEYFRGRLWQMLDENYSQPTVERHREIANLWKSFRARYAENFAAKHDLVMKSHYLQEQFDEIMRSDEWREFENLSQLPIFRPQIRREVQSDLQSLRELDCRFDVQEMLESHPFCACSFNLTQIGEWEKLPEKLRGDINRGRADFHHALRKEAARLIPSARELASAGEFVEAAARLEINLSAPDFPLLTADEINLIRRALPAASEPSFDVLSNNNW